MTFLPFNFEILLEKYFPKEDNLFQNIHIIFRFKDLATITKMIQHHCGYRTNSPFFHNLCSICVALNFCKFSIIRRTKQSTTGKFTQIFLHSDKKPIDFRHILMGENVFESTTMIQPQLFSYSFNGPPEAVLLDTSSIQPDRILLMDDFFHVLIYHGQVNT